jgi:hypothetical protein
MSKKFLSGALIFLYGCATLQFVRFYVKSTDFYLNMSAYLTGHERLPFQERVLPILFLRPMFDSTWFMRHLAHSNGAFTAALGPFYIISLIALAFAGIYTQKLYLAVSAHRTLSFLVYPLFLFTVMWSYAIHSEADYSYPYDLPSLAFFAAGLYYIYRRSFKGLFFVILIGTFNRETTLFLIVVYIIDAAARPLASPLEAQRMSASARLWNRFDLRLVDWKRVFLLGAVWLAIKLSLAHLFVHNSNAESFLRIDYNLARLRPRLLPAMLNICGYTIPLIVVFHRLLKPVRFRNYLLLLPVWFAAMFCSGVLVETRIYGELCSYASVAAVLIVEESVARRMKRSRLEPVLMNEPERLAA